MGEVTHTDTGALAGVRVLDCSSGRAGPVAGMLLADFGAEVVKVETPGGDAGRDEPGFAVWNRAKASVVLDGGIDASRLESLVRGADVLVTSVPALIDPDEAAALNSRVVALHTPPTLGPAPWAGGAESEALIAAWLGIPLRQASFDGGPVDSIYPIVTTLQGVWAAACAVAALVEREKSGLGQIVTVSGEHGAMIAAAGALTFARDALGTETPSSSRRRIGGPGGSVPFYRTYRCGDGEWLFFAALTPRFTKLGLGALGLDELIDDPRLEGRGRAGMLDPANSPWVIETIAAEFMTATRDEWLSRLQNVGCPAGAVLDRESWLDHPQVDAIGMRLEVDDPERGRVVLPGVPLSLSRSPGRVRGPAPVLGGSPLPNRDERSVHGSVSGERRSVGPLTDLRVLDLGAIIAGPFTASLLAELGADVIKVEPLTGDSFRGPGFAAYNKGQRGIALDLRHPAGRAALLDLVRTADVVIDNYRPGVLDRLDIGWEALQSVNPNVISASITGFGQGGPHGDDAGFDPVLQAMSGMMKAQGGDSDPVFFTVPVNDVAASAMVAFGATLAIFHRARAGVAQKVTTSLAAMSVFLQTEALVRFAGRELAAVGSRDHLGPAQTDRFYRTQDGWFRLQATGGDVASKLESVGIDMTGDLETAIETWASLRTREETLRALFDVGLSATAARTIDEIAADLRTHDAGILHQDPRPGRDGWTAGRHAHFSRTTRHDTLVAPALGEHAREVFAELGYTPEQFNDLIGSGAALARDT